MTKKVWASLLIMCLCSCGDTQPDTGMHTSMENPLNSLDAELSVQLLTGQSDGTGTYCDAVPLELCIGSADNCYAIEGLAGAECRDPATGCYDTGALCLIASHAIDGTHQDDHPLVNHPDDWDTLFLKNPASVNFVLERVWISINYTSANQIFDFVDEQDLGHWYDSSTISLHEMVRASRERAVEAQLGLGPGEFDLLPKQIQEGAYDLGQAGIIKYKPWEDGTQNGCDEYYAYFASQFTNNIHHHCIYDDNSCTYWRNWTTTNSHGALSSAQFRRSNRLAQVIFTEQPVGNATNRVAIEGIYRLDTNGLPTAEVYTPKPGDFFLKLNHPCVGNFHVMMYVGGYQDLSAGDQAHFSADILHKSSSVMINTWDVNYGYLNRKVDHTTTDCARYEGDYYRFFFFGEADHDVDPDGAGPLTSGARPGENYPVTGPNLGFRSTQSAILNGTM